MHRQSQGSRAITRPDQDPQTHEVERANPPGLWLGAAFGLAAGLFVAKAAGWTGLPWLALVLAAAVLAASGIALHRWANARVEAAQDALREAEALRARIQTDEVTGLPNRTGFRAALADLADGRADHEQLVLLRMDVRRFRAINSVLGSANCDRLLVETAKRVSKFDGARRVAARLGSGEFALAAVLATDGEARELAQQVNDALARPLRIAERLFEDGAAVGVAMLPAHATKPLLLLEDAELALAQAEAAGLREPLFFDAAMTRARIERREIEDELRAAIMKDELSIYFQPIIDLASGEIRGFEALVRWFHPEHGELPPSRFIPVAEETGLIITLGNWITAQAARAASRWPEHVTLAVNLSPVQIRAPGAALGILAAMRNAGLDPARLELEVTESLFEEDDANIDDFMAEMTREGVGFTLDDFGTGSSALHYIHRYPFRSIKVDRSFVSGPRLGRESDAIIRAVAEMGRTLNMEIVAEGLETIEQVQKVQQAGCTLGQGYYFSRPVPDYMAVMLLAEESRDGTRRAV